MQKIKISKKELYNLYWKQKLCSRKIAKLFGVSRKGIDYWMEKYNIPHRTLKEIMSSSHPRLKKIKIQKLISEKAYIWGVLCGDAWLEKTRLSLEIQKRDKEFVKYFSKCIKKVYNIIPSFSERKRGQYNHIMVRASSKLMIDDLKQIKIGKHKWIVPKEIRKTNNKKLIGMFLRGFCDSEGSVDKRGKGIILSSINFIGLKEINKLFLKVDIKCKLRKNNIYLIGIYGKNNFYNFLKNVGFTIKRKQLKLEKILKSYKN